MRKVINFINKTLRDVYCSYLGLKSRYRNVIIHHFYYNGWWWGWFEVERQYKKART